MSWVGGKKALREEVVRRFPLYYERYIEVFGGGGWVLFHKNPGNDFEVYNDFNGLLTNLYRCVREKPDLLMGSLRYVLNAREDFDRARLALRRKRTIGPEGGVVLPDHPPELRLRPHKLRQSAPRSVGGFPAH